MEQKEQEVYELTDLNVESVGLVFRGANRKPFYVIKSEEVKMSENEDFAAILDELETVSEVNESAWSRLVGVVKSVLTKPEPEPAPAPPVEETSSEAGDTENFAQVVAQMKQRLEEEFTAKLEREREARKVIEEAFAQEQRKRRLVEFGQVAEQFSSLPGTDKQFAADLMAVHDADAEVYGRLSAILKAANEAIEKGALFSQISVGGSEAGTGDPFENAVEALRKERFSTEDYHQGWAKAFDLAMEQHPDMAAAYARKH